MVSDTGSNFEMMPRKADASALIIAHSNSSLRSARDLIFLPGFLASRRAMVQTATTPHSRLIALIAASGNRPLGRVRRMVRFARHPILGSSNRVQFIGFVAVL